MAKRKMSKENEAMARHEQYQKVWIKCDLAWSKGGESLSDEPYSNRETEYRHYEVDDAFLVKKPPKGEYGYDSVAVPDWKEGTSEIYAILIHYSTGDTFGRTEGCIAIPIAFVDANEANRVAKKLDCWDNKDETFTDLEYGFYKKWTGYFETLMGVEVKKLTLSGAALYSSKRRR